MEGKTYCYIPNLPNPIYAQHHYCGNHLRADDDGELSCPVIEGKEDAMKGKVYDIVITVCRLLNPNHNRLSRSCVVYASIVKIRNLFHCQEVF